MRQQNLDDMDIGVQSPVDLPRKVGENDDFLQEHDDMLTCFFSKRKLEAIQKTLAYKEKEEAKKKDRAWKKLKHRKGQKKFCMIDEQLGKNSIASHNSTTKPASSKEV